MKTDYPVKIKCSAKAIEEFAACETGRWEDHGHGDHNGPACEGESMCGPLAVDILSRWKTVIEVRDQAEAEEIYWAAGSGTFQIDHGYEGEPCYLRTATRIADALAPYVDHSKWHIKVTYPSGY